MRWTVLFFVARLDRQWIKRDVLFGTLIPKNVRTNILWDEKMSKHFPSIST